MKDLKEGQTFKTKKRIETARGAIFKKGEEVVFSHWHQGTLGRVNVFFGEGDKHFSLPVKYTKLEDYLTEVK